MFVGVGVHCAHACVWCMYVCLWVCTCVCGCAPVGVGVIRERERQYMICVSHEGEGGREKYFMERVKASMYLHNAKEHQRNKHVS